MSLRDVSVAFSGRPAVRDVSFDVRARRITALIGPSGSGKTTLLRALNRMHDTVRSAKVTGTVTLGDTDVYAPSTDATLLRSRVGMVFQRPNPFPTMSIYENAVAGLRFNGIRKKALLDEAAESALVAAALWDSVRDRLKARASTLSGGEQQRLCIARALAVEPEVLLMDEPTSSLDPVATTRIEELVGELKDRVTIVIVTHNMQQALRVSDDCAFLLMAAGPGRRARRVRADAQPLPRAGRPAHARLRQRPLRLTTSSAGARLPGGRIRLRVALPRAVGDRPGCCPVRVAGCDRASSVGIEAEPDPAHGDDVLGVGGVRLELGPQPVDVGVEGPGVRQVAVGPQEVDELVTGADPPGRREEHGEQVELASGQVGVVTADGHLPAQEVDGSPGRRRPPAAARRAPVRADARRTRARGSNTIRGSAGGDTRRRMACMRATSSRSRKGLVTYPAAPSSRPRTTSSSVSTALTMTMGTCEVAASGGRPRCRAFPGAACPRGRCRARRRRSTLEGLVAVGRRGDVEPFQAEPGDEASRYDSSSSTTSTLTFPPSRPAGGSTGRTIGSRGERKDDGPATDR